jgi:hypothetical protein
VLFCCEDYFHQSAMDFFEKNGGDVKVRRRRVGASIHQVNAG